MDDNHDKEYTANDVARSSQHRMTEERNSALISAK